MPGIEIKGRSKIANYRHGGRTGKFGGGRTNLLEELGRVEAEPSNRNRRAEISRVHGELNRGYAKGGRAGHAHGMSAVKKAIKKVTEPQGVFKPKDFKGKGSDKIRSLLKGKKTHGKDVPTMAAEVGRIELKKGRLAITKADLAKSDLWRKRELKRRSKIGRKSKWDIKGGIGGHPLNPFRMHAESKALDWGSKRKDVYVRTRDDLKKSQDPNVKKVAEGFQQMDYKDNAKGTYEEKDYAPKLTKRIHGRLGKKTGGKSDKN